MGFLLSLCKYREKRKKERSSLLRFSCFGPWDLSEEEMKQIMAFMLHDKYGDDVSETDRAMSTALLTGTAGVDYDKLLQDPEIIDYCKPTPEQRARFEARLMEEVARIQGAKRAERDKNTEMEGC